ncbi:MAG TPA: thermonuclease family protein [Aliidongia sp.]|uniref:thermonuclease family protein n=1 Tax=Aliidongia sp. TaxID=1914230 RepID=UPI002DDCB2DF|nr:thermonuclease family protein [Aliidongia sp.]HEV2678295.1 thermonuclease family protein [Aliidongia sp.]
MAGRWLIGMAAAFLAVTAPAGARSRSGASVALDLPEIANGIVASVEDGVTLTLDDGRVLRLAGLLAPAPPLTMGQDASWPSAEAARRALADLTLGKNVSLHAAQPAPDRHNRLVGQLVAADGTWLQPVLLRQGADRVEPAPNAGTVAAPLLKAEAEARRRHKGLWRLPAYGVRTPETLTARDTGSFVLVEGRVLSIAPTHEATYLDFAQDWHHGFTVRIPHGVLQRASGFDPAALEGRRIRVRGWLVYEGRPILDLADLAALEPLPGRRKPPAPP